MADINALLSSIRPRIADDDPTSQTYSDDQLKKYLVNAAKQLSLELEADFVVDLDAGTVTHKNSSDLTETETTLLEVQTAIEVVKAEKIQADRDATSFRTEAMTVTRTDRPRFIQETLDRLETDKNRCLMAIGYLF